MGKGYWDQDGEPHWLYFRSFVKDGRHMAWPDWMKSNQSFELLPWYATGANMQAEVLDLTEGRCHVCDSTGLKMWLYQGSECPRCKDDVLHASFTG